MIRVLHLRSSAGFYGAERVLVTLLKKLPPAGVHPVLVTIENYLNGNRDLLKCAREQGSLAFEIPCGSRWSFETLKCLIAIAREHEVGCIHTHDYKSHVYGLLAARALKVPVAATLHGWISNTINLRVYQWIEQLALRQFCVVVTVTAAMSERMRARGLSRARLRTIENGVDTDIFGPKCLGFGREHWGLSSDHFVFGTVARLSAEKGQRHAIEALAPVLERHPRARLMLVGEGADRGILQARARELGIEDHVIFTGKHSQVQRVLHDIDCYLSPSLTEGMPMILLEAMASGVPVIATDVGAVGTMLAGGGGILVPARDVAALSHAMMTILDKKIDTVATASLARQRCVDIYSAARQAGAYSDVYKALVSV